MHVLDLHLVADWLDEAAEDIETWGEYATTYFQDKHDLEGTVQKVRARAARIRALIDAGQVKA